MKVTIENNGSFGWSESPIGDFDNDRPAKMAISLSCPLDKMKMTDRQDWANHHRTLMAPDRRERKYVVEGMVSLFGPTPNFL
jgi:hypothetical protein